MQGRLASLLALALPVLAGLAYLLIAGAPQHYAVTNGAVLLAGLAWIAFSPPVHAQRARRIAIGVLLALLLLPLVTGPELNGIARWLPLGPFQLNSSMLAIPALVVLAAREREWAASILLVAIFATLIQPDAAGALALTFSAVALHDVTRDWRVGVAAILGFVSMLLATLRGELPAQPFVERVLQESAATLPWMTLVMGIALAASIALIFFLAPLSKAQRFALGGSLFGFVMMSMMNNYPSPLIAYGAAPILGYALALGMSAAPQEPGND